VSAQTGDAQYVLAYNPKRVIKLLGMPKTLQAMRLLGA